MPRRRGDDDDGDFPLLWSSRAPEQQDLTPFGEIRSSATAATSDNYGKIRASLFGEDEATLKSPQPRGARGSFEWVPRDHSTWPCGPTSFGPRGSPLFGLLLPSFHSRKK